MAAGPRPQERRIALELQYDGTGFCGWQFQNEGRTVQDDIERALHILTREETRVIASGRTDSGVHALGQVVHFDLRSDISLDKLCISLNGILSRDIAVVNAYAVPADFHARFSAVQREYRYVLYNHPLRSPFMQYRAMWVKDSLDPDYMDDALSYLVGEHDFASFCKKISADNGTIRKIHYIRVEKKEHYLYVVIGGNAFLHNMIRIIIGTVVEMSKNNDNPVKMKEILERRDRDVSGSTAPPYGLYLNWIDYDPPLDSMESAF